MIVVMSILSMILGVFAFLRFGAAQQSVSLDFHAAALQSVQHLVAPLQRDFDELVSDPLTLTFTEPRPHRAISFLKVADVAGRYGLALTVDGSPLTEKVGYVFDQGTHRVYRNGAPILSAMFEDVTFVYLPARPDEPEVPPHGDVLLVEARYVPEDKVGRVQPGVPQAHFKLAFHSIQGTNNHVYEEWVGDR
jgi:hypothetical protein